MPISSIATEFYFLRHGRTDANAQDLTSGGDWDVALNSEGKEQALEVLREFKNLGLKFGSLCVSPMLRTCQTADCLSELTQNRHEIEDLREWRLGEWERQPFRKIAQDFLGFGEPEMGERRHEFNARVLRGLKQAVNNSGPVLIVSHGGVWHSLVRHLKLPSITPKNCEPYRVFRHKEIWAVERILSR